MGKGARFTLDQISAMPARVRSQVSAALEGNIRSTGITAGPEPQIAVKAAKPAKAKLRQTESLSQQEVIKWWALECSQHGLPEKCLKAFPLQGARTAGNGSRLKAEGMRAGTLDMFFGVARGQHHGFWIELKSPKGVITPSQKEMLKLELAQGFATVVCRSAQEAKAAIRAYLIIMPTT